MTLRRKGRECVVLGGWCRGSRKDAKTQRAGVGGLWLVLGGWEWSCCFLCVFAS